MLILLGFNLLFIFIYVKLLGIVVLIFDVKNQTKNNSEISVPFSWHLSYKNYPCELWQATS
jgi:hypothetical protein